MSYSGKWLLVAIVLTLLAAVIVPGCGGGGGGGGVVRVMGGPIFLMDAAGNQALTTLKAGTQQTFTFQVSNLPDTVSLSYQGPISGTTSATKNGAVYTFSVSALQVTRPTNATIYINGTQYTALLTVTP